MKSIYLVVIGIFLIIGCDSSITDSNHLEMQNVEGGEVTQLQSTNSNNSLASCPNISSSDFSVTDFGHKIRVTYNDAAVYPVVSWDTNNPQTTTLDYDGGSWAYYHNNGYGYLEIKITVSDGGVNCTSVHLINY